MKTKKIISTLLAVVVLLIPIKPIQAYENTAILSNSQETIVNQETINIEGVPVVFTLYNNNGVYSETVSIKKDKNQLLKTESANSNNDELMASIIKVADQRAEKIYDDYLSDSSLSDNNLVVNKNNTISSIYQWTESKHNAAPGTGIGENINTYAGHWTEVDYTVVDTAGSMNAYDGASRVYYAGTKTVTNMSLTETLSRRSWEISVSYPLGFSVAPSNTSATLSSYWPENSSICTQYRNNFSASAILNSGTFVNVNTQVQVYIGSSSYTSSVNSSW